MKRATAPGDLLPVLAMTHSCALDGVEAYIVRVEARLSPGLPRMTVVGLPDAAVREGRERVRAALRLAAGELLVASAALVNLSPAARRKAGASFDLAVAVALAAAGGRCPTELLPRTAMLGELGIDGSLRAVDGVLPAALAAAAAGLDNLIVPRENAAEALAGPGMRVFAAASLTEVLSLLADGLKDPLAARPVAPLADGEAPGSASEGGDRLAEIRGQAMAKRALEIAAAGHHHVLMKGPPGVGKSMLARRLPLLLPRLGPHEAIETTSVHSAAGLNRGAGLHIDPPFRSPHHSSSAAGLVGGGPAADPGEISLAHNGVLFLDELAEFSPHVLNHLREPLEEGRLTISRAGRRRTLPARFLLVAAMNPCPCGYLDSGVRDCICPASAIDRYQARLAGPLLDRIDLVVAVPRLDYAELRAEPSGETTQAVCQRVAEARKRAAKRPPRTRLIDSLAAEADRLLAKAADKLALSGRSITRTTRVARTIADLGGSPGIEARHISEALAYRAPQS